MEMKDMQQEDGMVTESVGKMQHAQATRRRLATMVAGPAMSWRLEASAQRSKLGCKKKGLEI